MIVDRIERFETYFGKSASIEKIANFLKTLSPAAEEKEYEIDGRDIFARVMSYETVARREGKVEAHDEYADIQASIAGSEEIEWLPRKGLAEAAAYDRKKDVLFFAKPARPLCAIRNVPGSFSLFFPEDAHMPKLMDGGLPGRVKKVVVKIRVSILKAAIK
ncbi:MAG TPA: YhcH/YjgK/YiaL family protein [bacterium]|nr:YhcH/YjgK/YiaL family protein [bacterium]